ncbi:hypothetical protein AL053_24815 [Pseudomonas savastanoi pv. fraxini]|nr:hypothetical protein AL053_24815 [Pseudomonas savastanoi pv. fraxini]PAB27858.1 hypothetical protein CCZ00_21555 [Pseudomonas savastanoi pv. fraxini]
MSCSCIGRAWIKLTEARSKRGALIAWLTIVPTLRVGIQFWTLCFLFMTQSVTYGIPTRSVGTMVITMRGTNQPR